MNNKAVELAKARIAELNTDLAKVVDELKSIKESHSGSITPESIQRLSELQSQLLTYKAGQAELKNLVGLLE